MHRPQWTMSSSLEEILLGGSTLRTEMLLNDFLRSNLGGRGVVDTNENVTMEMFVQDPEMFIQNERLLRIITTSPPYRELEKRKKLLEAINKLHHEGVLSLGQWRDDEGKDTITPLARGKLNAAITQVQTAESREVKERVSREEEERLRRALEMKFTISTKLEEVLFKGEFRYKDMNLNDFLTVRLGERGVLDANRNVLLKEFIKDPTKYIRVKGVLNEIKKIDRFLRMERTVRDEMDMEEDVSKLQQAGVDNLMTWLVAPVEVKATVHCITKAFFDAALEEARNRMATSTPIYLEGCYESVYNARWHHVVEVPDGEGTGLEVREGEAPQSWTYKKVGNTLEKDDDVEQSGAARLRLMVLTSEKGWPYSWEQGVESLPDCYVNCEVDRVWQIVRGDLTEWSSPDAGDYFKPKRRLLVGTPGIGKSMGAGSYLLYQLLHYDAEQLQVVFYLIADRTFLFDKITKTVLAYREDPRIDDVVNIFSDRWFKGYCIYDATLACRQPPAGLPCRGWGMIVVTPPEKNESERWTKKMDTTAIVTNCPEENDVRAMCIWMKRNRPLQEQAEYWKEVRGRMNNVGPILRSIFGKQAYDDRIKACQQAVDGSTASELERNLGIGCCYTRPMTATCLESL
ncbi:putative retrotransposon hot spot (RHS) protein [Trypanosoma cruzi]|uniref:Putative retrotransposon hot spot (RHS) protein n=1 Tax=Trypanosoma cruzi TaxID=5693 RepID=A0A2V2VEI6_TRYCR|nr:putative retrotransposon hot spot (RHS) protein [Trypanosoma cruzi]